MAESFHLQQSRILKLNDKAFHHKYMVKRFVALLARLLSIVGVMIGSGVITLMIYKMCITPSDAENGALYFSMMSRITTGSLFATFGSAIIAVFSLYTTRSLSSFKDCLGVLMQELARDDTHGDLWRRCSFIPRIQRTRIDGKDYFMGVDSVKISFHIGVDEKEMLLPTTLVDFGDIATLRYFIYMKILRKKYIEELVYREQLAEYPVWDCVTQIYEDVLMYKICYFCVWVGACFVFQSIIFTFFYPALYSLLGSI